MNNKREYPPITDEEEGEETYTSLSKIYSHHQHATHEEMKARELEREGPKEWSNKLENERVYVTDNGYLVRGHGPPEAPTNVQVIERVEKIDNVEKNQDKGKVGRELEREALKAKESRSRSDGKERKEEVNHAKRDIVHKPTNTKREKNEVVRSKSIDNRDSRHQTKKKEDKLVRKENAATAKSNSKPVERINSKRREVELKERTSPQVPVQAFEHNDDSISNISQINSSFSHSPPLSPSRSPAMVQDETNPSGDDMITNTNEIYQKEPSCNSEDLRLFEMEFDQSTTQFKKSILVLPCLEQNRDFVLLILNRKVYWSCTKGIQLR